MPTSSPADLELLRLLAALAVPALYLLAIAASVGAPLRRAWQAAGVAAGSAFLVAVAGLAAWAWQGALVVRGGTLLRLGDAAAVTSSVRIDAVGAIVLPLVAFIGWVIVRYSRTYLAGEPGQPRYARALLATLASVAIVVVTNNLAVLALAWLGTSLALHRLLTFYGDRPQALVAAHKKFLASRLGDLCLAGAIVLVARALGTLEIDLAIARAAALPAPTFALQAAAVLFAVAALLKCAQLPIHGWLLQVMEAPTPVSALLHAGVVNLGGVLLLRLGGLVADVAAAQTLLVVVGSTTAVVAALVMTTRISVKVMLAWSTCAQMGFMLMECGLGAHGLALLHLVAHSLYKAHAFLAAGGAVEQARLRQLSAAEPPLPIAASMASAAGGIALVAGAAWLWDVRSADAPAFWALGAVVAFALAPMLSAQATRLGARWRAGFAFGAMAVAIAYVGVHAAVGERLDIGAHVGGAAGAAIAPLTKIAQAAIAQGAGTQGVVAQVEGARNAGAHVAQLAQAAWVLAAFALLFVVQSVLRAHPHGRLGRTLYPWFYGGLYLDELFTRITFRVWPARLPPSRPARPLATTTAAVPGAL